MAGGARARYSTETRRGSERLSAGSSIPIPVLRAPAQALRSHALSGHELSLLDISTPCWPCERPLLPLCSRDKVTLAHSEPFATRSAHCSSDPTGRTAAAEGLRFTGSFAEKDGHGGQAELSRAAHEMLKRLARVLEERDHVEMQV